MATLLKVQERNRLNLLCTNLSIHHASLQKYLPEEIGDFLRAEIQKSVPYNARPILFVNAALNDESITFIILTVEMG